MIQSMPRRAALVFVFGGTIGISAFLHFFVVGRKGEYLVLISNNCKILTFSYFSGEHLITTEPDWIKANREYMKFQRNNPIFGKLPHVMHILHFYV